MVKWHRTLYLADVWNETYESPEDLRALAGIIVQRLKEMPKITTNAFYDNERIQLIEDFSDFMEWQDPTVDDFDELMDDLYSWGDHTVATGATFSATEKLCWVQTQA